MYPPWHVTEDTSPVLHAVGIGRATGTSSTPIKSSFESPQRALERRNREREERIRQEVMEEKQGAKMAVLEEKLDGIREILLTVLKKVSLD
jgi:hypothetical protein